MHTHTHTHTPTHSHTHRQLALVTVPTAPAFVIAHSPADGRSLALSFLFYFFLFSSAGVRLHYSAFSLALFFWSGLNADWASSYPLPPLYTLVDQRLRRLWIFFFWLLFLFLLWFSLWRTRSASISFILVSGVYWGISFGVATRHFSRPFWSTVNWGI